MTKIKNKGMTHFVLILFSVKKNNQDYIYSKSICIIRLNRHAEKEIVSSRNFHNIVKDKIKEDNCSF